MNTGSSAPDDLFAKLEALNRTLSTVGQTLGDVGGSLGSVSTALDVDHAWKKRAKVVVGLIAGLIGIVLLAVVIVLQAVHGLKGHINASHGSVAVEIDCRNRRAQAGYPPPPDSSKACVEQTPAQLQADGETNRP